MGLVQLDKVFPLVKYLIKNIFEFDDLGERLMK